MSISTKPLLSSEFSISSPPTDLPSLNKNCCDKRSTRFNISLAIALISFVGIILGAYLCGTNSVIGGVGILSTCVPIMIGAVIGVVTFLKKPRKKMTPVHSMRTRDYSHQYENDRTDYKNFSTRHQEIAKRATKKPKKDEESCGCESCAFDPSKISEVAKRNFDPYPWALSPHPDELKEEEVWKRIKYLEKQPGARYPVSHTYGRAHERLTLYWNQKCRGLPEKKQPPEFKDSCIIF